MSARLPPVRICLMYDCLYPWTVGGAERWYRNLAAELVAAGHDVTYLTRKQWPDEEPPEIEGVRVVAVSREDPLYGPDGTRRIGPPLRFGWGVLCHLLRHRRSYDVVHTCSFPFFSLLAARVALAGRPTLLGVDWFEVWTPGYWRDYLGPVGGRIGHAVQRLCARMTPLAFVFSRLHGRRLVDEGLRSEPTVLAGLYAGPTEPRADAATGDREPLAVFAGRHIPEKRAPLVPAAVARVPGMRGIVFGDGPERPKVIEAIEREGVGDRVSAPGFVEAGEIDAAFARATCLVLPSAREGYGMVVIEAAAAGTPSVVVAGEDNSSVELISPGENGFVAAAPTPEAVAAEIERVREGGAALRERTVAWFRREAPRLTVAASAREVLARYERAAR